MTQRRRYGNSPLQNQLGTGQISRQVEASLLRRGIKFAAYLGRDDDTPLLITSQHANLYQRLGEQLETFFDNDRGLPMQYRCASSVAENIPS